MSTPDITWSSGAHPTVGGTGDVPCSGDLLLGALAACQETTIRMVAANMGIELDSLEVDIEADWDARGTLAMGDYPIWLTASRCTTRVTVPQDVKGERRIGCFAAPRSIASCSIPFETASRSTRASRSPRLLKFPPPLAGEPMSSGSRDFPRGQGRVGVSEMRSQLAEPFQDEEASVGRDDLLLFQPPGVLVRNEHGVEPGLQCWVDVGAR